MSKVLNLGGFGCVLSPALVFYDSKIVNETNKSQYVTKFGSNIEEEYNFCEIALGLLGPSGREIGIFPVDPLHCGLTLKDLGPNGRQILDKCERVLNEREIIGSEASYYKYKKPLAAGLIDQSSYLCAIQYPLYRYDINGFFREFTTQTLENKINIATFLEKNLDSCLKRLHGAGIVHLDIKAGNIGLVEEGGGIAKLADWDFAAFQMYPETINECYERTSKPNYLRYYRDLCNPLVNILNIGLESFNKIDYIRELTNNQKFLCLKFVDQCCMKSLYLNFWRECGQYLQYKKKYDDFLADYISSVYKPYKLAFDDTEEVEEED